MLQLLRGAGYRVTSERKAVLDAVLASCRPFSGGDVVAQVSRRDPSVGRATVFRTLEVLVDLGVIGRVHQPGVDAAYVLCSQDHHHHAICSRCGLVVELPGCPLDDAAEKEATAAGFRLESHRLEYYGVCGQCQAKGTS